MRLPGLPPTTLVEVRGGPLAVHDVPGPQDRPAALLVPGYTGSKEDFRLLLGPLAADRRVVALDQRGQYESPGAASPDDHTVEALAADVLGLVDALGLRPVHLLGHSFGGLVCRAAVLADPGAVASLTLLSSGPSALTGPRVELLPHLAPLLDAGGVQAVADALDAVAAADPRRAQVPPEVQAFLRHRFLANSPVALRAMADQLTGEPDRVDALAAVAAERALPLLVAHGEGDDAWTPSAQAEMARRLGAQYAVVPGALHSAAVEAPAATAALLADFWRRADAGPVVAARAGSAAR